MAAQPPPAQGAPQAQYDDGYGPPAQGQNAYYTDDQYDQYNDQQGAQQPYDNNQQHNDAYYDEKCVIYVLGNRSRANSSAVLITITSRRARITNSKTAITTIAASRVIKTSITTTSIMIKEALKQDMGKRAMQGLFHPLSPMASSRTDSFQWTAAPSCSR